MKNHIKTLKRFTKSGKDYVSRARPELQHIVVEDNTAYATNEFAMLAFETNTPDGVYDTSTGEPMKIEANTQLSSVLPNGNPEITVYLNADYLFKMAQALKKTELDTGLKNVQVEFHGEYKPVVFRSKDKEGKQITGAIMPIRN